MQYAPELEIFHHVTQMHMDTSRS